MSSTNGTHELVEYKENVHPCVSLAMNAELMREFTTTEVNISLSQMHPLKSPRPDSYSACFYQMSWNIVHTEVCNAVLDFVSSGNFVNSINNTHIVLILKKKRCTRATDYRPISLYNVLYKLMAKVLANRLKKVLPSIISPNQSVFIPRWHINDNIIVAFEALHTMSTRLKRRKGFMALKLDMSKAYDKVEWNFLEAVMRRLGFDDRWVSLIMVCVRTATYYVLVNGQPYGHIQPT